MKYMEEVVSNKRSNSNSNSSSNNYNIIEY